MHRYSLCQTRLTLKTHMVPETENRTSCLTTVSQTITVSSCQSDISNQCRIKRPWHCRHGRMVGGGGSGPPGNPPPLRTSYVGGWVQGCGRNWSGADPPPSLRPRLPRGVHRFLSCQCGLIAPVQGCRGMGAGVLPSDTSMCRRGHMRVRGHSESGSGATRTSRAWPLPFGEDLPLRRGMRVRAGGRAGDAPFSLASQIRVPMHP